MAGLSVQVKEGEYFDVALRRFRRSCEKAGILTEAREREYYEKPTAARKRKVAAAIKRWRKQERLNKPPVKQQRRTKAVKSRSRFTKSRN